MAESDENRPILEMLAEGIFATWPRPIVNDPDRISGLTRDGAWALLSSIDGVHMPVNLRVDRASLMSFVRGERPASPFRSG